MEVIGLKKITDLISLWFDKNFELKTNVNFDFIP